MFVAFGLALSLLASCGGATPPAATIGETQITNEQLAHEVNVFEFLSELSQQPCGTPEGRETEQSACSRFALSSVIEERFAAMYAVAHDIAVTNSDIQPALDNLDQQVGKKRVDELLAAHDLTRDDLSEIARRSLVLEHVQSAVTEERLTDDAVLRRYQENMADYTTVSVEHILVQTKAEADAVYAQATAPGATEEEFKSLARQVSIDPSAKQNGGDLGSALASTYVPSFGRAAASLEPGQVSQPVHSRFGWHVIRLVDKQVLIIDEFNAWMREQITTQGVDVNPRYGRYDLRNLEVARIASTVGGNDASPPPSPSA